MSLLTMGLGHLTTITMGLGNSVVIYRVQRRYQTGKVEFVNKSPDVNFDDNIDDVGFRTGRKLNAGFDDRNTEAKIGRV